MYISVHMSFSSVLEGLMIRNPLERWTKLPPLVTFSKGVVLSKEVQGEELVNDGSSIRTSSVW